MVASVEARRRPSCAMYAHEIGRMPRCPTAPPRPRRMACVPPRSHDRVPGQERREVRRDADRPHARAAAAVRDAERLVQVQVADVGADVARAGRGRPARSCSRRPCTPGRRARGRSRQISRIASSNTPCVDGIGHHQRRERVACAASAFAREVGDVDVAAASSLFTTTTFMPAITALAGLVPCADCGMRQTSRCASPRARWYARITSRPAYSPCEPAFGCSDTAAKPVISASCVLELPEQHLGSPPPGRAARTGAAGRTRGQRHRHHLGRRVQLHRARAERDHRVVSDRSRASSRLM